MRITHIGPVYPYRGGIAHFTTFLSQKFIDAQNEVQVISFKKLYPKWLYPGKTEKDPSNTPFKVKSIFPLVPINPFTWEKTVNLIIQFKPDIVIIQWWTIYLSFVYAYIAFRLKKHNIKVVYIVHNVIQHESHILDKELTQFALNQGNYFIVQTLREKDRLLKLLPKREIEVLPHPIYDMFINQKVPKIEARQKLGISEHASVLLFFGIVRPYKGLIYLLDAVSHLKMTDPNLQLVIAGECWENVNIYKNKISELGIADMIRFENRYIPNEEVGLYFSAADVFVAPYIGGTQSGAIRIALSFQTPAVISEEIADEDLINHYGDYIRVVDPRNPIKFSATIKMVLDEIKNNGYLRNASPVKGSNDQWIDLINTLISKQ